MYTNEQNVISLAVTDPDLGFYEGADDTPALPVVKRREVNIYSKKWHAITVKPSVLKLSLIGKWKISESNKNLKIIHDNDSNSNLEVASSYGEASLLKLTN